MENATPFASPIAPFVDPAGSSGQDWSTILGAAGIVLSLVLLWTGIKKVELSSHAKTVLSFLDAALLVVGVIALGWPEGALLVFGVNALALLASSIRLAIQYDEILTDASIQNNSGRENVKALAKRLQSSGGAFKGIGPIKTALLVKYLSQRARTINEIELMAPHIAALWVIFRPDLETLVEKFDRLLRLSHTPASDSQRIADVLTSGTQRAAAKFDEMLDGMLAFYDPTSDQC